jgi:hypothetical protein
MSAFTGPLVIAEVKPGYRWRLMQAITYEVGEEHSARVIEVPAGFETDGASIPGFLRVVLSVWGTYGRAACLHDYLYSVLRNTELWNFGGLKVELHEAFRFSGVDSYRDDYARARAWADREFYTAMLACGTWPPLAFVMWVAVRLFGGFAVRRRQAQISRGRFARMESE